MKMGLFLHSMKMGRKLGSSSGSGLGPSPVLAWGVAALISLCLSSNVQAQSTPAPTVAASTTPVALATPSATALAFKDFFQMPFGPKGLSFTPKALALNGQRVSMVGYMVKTEEAQLGSFILSPRPLEINDHADGEANDLPANAVWVKFDPEQAQSWVAHRPGLLQIQGLLELGRQENAQAQVSWIRIQLSQDAVVVQGEPSKGSHQHTW